MNNISILDSILRSKSRCNGQRVGLLVQSIASSNNDINLYKVVKLALKELQKQALLNNFYLILTNSKAKILLTSGDNSLFPLQCKPVILPGLSLCENDAGTNAPALSIIDDQVVKVEKDEHSLLFFHGLTCCAAPIHDENSQIVGSISLWYRAENTTNDISILAAFLASTLESKWEAHKTQVQFFNSQQYAFTMMNNLSLSVISINHLDKIFWVNDVACNILNIRRTQLINSDFPKILPNWSQIKEELNKGEKYEDEENSFAVNQLRDKFLVNAYPIKSTDEGIIGFIITFRPMKRLINIINKLTGNSTHYHFDDMMSQDKKFLAQIDYAKSIANTPSSVLLTGETGTGKEVFAQAIHNASDRHAGSFVAINCGAISSSLIESELFGYEDGAFTGAKKGGRPGKFEMANGGTLFLDEIGDMPFEMQVKLLRTIQENEVVRVGGERSIPINVRIIAATNKNLEKEIEDKRFRIDLFYRINVITINIPPLRERMGDINLLIAHFLTIKAEKLNKKSPWLSDHFFQLVNSYSWPGNIRELENFIEKTVALDGKIDFIPNNFETIQGLSKSVPSTPLPKFIPLSLSEIERHGIENTLSAFQGNISQTAKCLDIGRNTLYSKMKNFQISLDRF